MLQREEVIVKSQRLSGVATGALALGMLAYSSAAIGNSSEQSRSRADVLTNPVQSSSAFLEGSPAPARDTTLFKGCEDDQSGSFTGNPRDRIEDARGGDTNPTGRVFAPVGGSEVEAPTDIDDEANCASRIDGLWVERSAQPAFDKNFEAGGWADGADTPELRALTHGVYTQPGFLVIQRSDDPDSQLTLRRPFLDKRSVTFTSVDNVRLDQALTRSAPAKRYRASQRVRGLGSNLSVRVASNGVLVLDIDGKLYVRPKPELSAKERAGQTPMEDAFNREATIQFIDSVARGFDVTTQNPNRFAENDKDFVFARQTGTEFYTKDRKIVPIDMQLDLLSDQGAVFFSSLISSGSDIQTAYASSFGISAKVGIDGKVSNKSGTAEGNLEASVGYGAGFSNSQFSQMQRSQSVSQAVGFSRQKQFALIRDHAQSELDGFFRDAVITAVQTGNYDRLIQTYGTHYPYATTFGSSGQTRHTTTKEGYRELVSNSENENESGGVNLLIAQTNVERSSSSQNSSSFETSTEYGTAYFDAVGGNGSWNEGGFTAGATAYPILKDMRPLADLLNPINFPGQPEIYDRGRKAFAAKIDNYLRRAGRSVKTGSLLPKIIPVERWTIRALSLACHGSGSIENSDRIQLQGGMTLKVNYPTDSVKDVFKAGTGKTYRGMFCNGKRYTATNADRFVLEGTAQQLREARYRVRSDLSEADFGSPIKALRKKKQGGLAQKVWPDNIYTGNSPWFALPSKNALDASGRLVRTYGVPGGAAGKQPDLRLRIEFQLVK